jgi:glycosyltransferase involved in cell wall biosynthesis
MKILFVVGDPGVRIEASVFGGLASFLFNLIKSFRDIGNEVTVLLSSDHEGERGDVKLGSCLKQRLPFKLFSILKSIHKIMYNFKFYKSYCPFFQKEAADCIFEKHCNFHLASSVIARKLGIPYIVQIDGPVEAMKRFGPAYFLSLASAIQRKVAERANAIVVVSEAMRNYLTEKGISSKKIFVVPNAADIELFNPQTVTEDIRSEYKLGDKIIIGFVGSMKKYHGIELIIKLAEDLIREEDNIHFLIIGPFEDRGQFEEALKSKGVSEHFTLTGGIPFKEVPAHISAMDICVMPDSNWNGSPIKIFEYGAMGKPVIAPRVSPVEEVIEDGKNGLLIIPGDEKDLRDKVLTLVHDHTLRKELGSKLMKHVREHHTWQKNAERIVDIYHAIM